MKINDLSEQEIVVLAALANATSDGDWVPVRDVREGVHLGGILFNKALRRLTSLKYVESDADKRLQVTKEGWEFVDMHAKGLLEAAAELRLERNEVIMEKASQRTAVTVRRILLSAAVLLLLSMVGVGMYSGGPNTTSGQFAAMKWWYFSNLVIVFGLVVVGGTFAKRNRGIRQQNLKAVGITLVAVLVSLLALWGNGALDSALGILGAIAGYLFGKDRSSDDAGEPSGQE